MRIKFSRGFSKKYNKSSAKIKKTFDKRLALFVKNPHHPQLRNHALTGKYKGYRSINVTGDCRALYMDYVDSYSGKNIIVFVLLGTHSQLYG